MKIGVVGTGRLGICFALLLDKAGHDVMASDIRSNYIDQLQRRQIQTHEPQVQDLLDTCRIEFTTNTREVISRSQVIYVMVATPSLPDGSYDISAVQRVVSDVAECDFDIAGKILVIGCTTNPGDCQHIQDRLRDKGIHVLYNPEFIAQGSIVHDLQQADLVLIGGENPAVIEHYQTLYHDIQTRPPCVHSMSLTSAEIVKIGINCFLTTKISYANMIGEVLVRSGQQHDVKSALAAIGSDARIGDRYLSYGFGYGGPCLPRDNRAFARYADGLGLDFGLGGIVDAFNESHTQFLAQHLAQCNRDHKPFYMSYLSYKRNTDIMESSQPLRLCLMLLSLGYQVYVEPSPYLPPDLVQNIIKQHGARFQLVPRQDLENQGQDIFPVEF